MVDAIERANLTLLLQIPRSGRCFTRLMMEDCRRHCMASNRKSDSFSPLEVVRLMADSANRDFNSCIVATGLAAATATAAVAVAVAVTVVGGFRGSGLVDLSTLGRPVDPVEGIVCRKVTKSRGRGSGAKGRASRHILKNCPREPADQQTRYRVWDLGLKH